MKSHGAYISTLHGGNKSGPGAALFAPNAKTTDTRKTGGWLVQKSIWRKFLFFFLMLELKP